MNLFNKYFLLVTFETDDNYLNRFDLIRNEKHTSHTAVLVETADWPLVISGKLSPPFRYFSALPDAALDPEMNIYRC